MSEMTRRDRDDLAKLARSRAKLATKALEERAAMLEADLEEQLASAYKFDDDEVWKQAMESATEVVNKARAEANAAVTKRCEELGIPEWARPSVGVGVGWSSRGQNAVNERRVELRRVGKAKIAAYKKRAAFEIEQHSLEVQSELIAGGLESEDAKRFAASMPTAAELMPELSIAELRKEIEAEPKRGTSDSEDWQLSPWRRRRELEAGLRATNTDMSGAELSQVVEDILSEDEGGDE